MEQARDLGASFVVAGEAGYPPLLYHIPGAPPLLCVKGNAALAALQCVIVGARNASAGGRKFARQLSADLSEEGISRCCLDWRAALTRRPMNPQRKGGQRRSLPAALTISIHGKCRAGNSPIGEKGLLRDRDAAGSVPRAEHFPRRNRINFWNVAGGATCGGGRPPLGIADSGSQWGAMSLRCRDHRLIPAPRAPTTDQGRGNASDEQCRNRKPEDRIFSSSADVLGTGTTD